MSEGKSVYAYQAVFVSCKNHDCPCRQNPILLHLPTTEDTFEHVQGSTNLSFPLIVACQVCGYVYGHRAHERQVREFWQTAPLPHRTRIACAETKCGEKNCEVHMRIHIVLDKATPLETLRDATYRWTFSPTATCANGHHIRPAASYCFLWLREPTSSQ